MHSLCRKADHPFSRTDRRLNHVIEVLALRPPQEPIQRAATSTADTNEIEQWCQERGENAATGTINSFHKDAISHCIQEKLFEMTGRTFEKWDNFFVCGLDSLQALLLSRYLKLRFSNPRITIGTVYAAPSIQHLVRAVQSGAVSILAPEDTKELHIQPRKQLVEERVSLFSAKLDKILPARRASVIATSPGEMRVILTGSTGSLGSHILDELLSRPEVSHVYCLNRAVDGGLTRQFMRRYEAYPNDMHDHDFSTRISFLHANLAEPNLGLTDWSYTALQASVTHVVYNAWPVNFNVPLSAYEPQLEGIVNLVRFVKSCVTLSQPRLLFVSSVSAASNMSLREGGKVPEAVLTDDPTASAPMGYGESNYIGERLLAHASAKLSVDARIMRLGQVAGPVGASCAEWNRTEWLPSVLLSGRYIGALPDKLPGMLGRVDWVPVDVAARSAFELATAEAAASDGGCSLYNVLNTRTMRWEDLVPVIVKQLDQATGASDLGMARTDVVPFTAWLELVRASLEEDSGNESDEEVAQALDQNPAAKLLDFFETSRHTERLLAWDTARATAASEALRTLDSVKVEWLQRWIRQWVG